MTTDQIRAVDSFFDTAAAPDDLVSEAEEHARQIVAKARYEAFRMVTDARSEAEAILEEARPIHQLGGEDVPEAFETPDARLEAEETAQAIVEEARVTAASISEELVERARDEAAQIVSDANARLSADHTELLAEYQALEQKVEGARSVLATLEARLAAIAAPQPELQTVAPAPLPTNEATSEARVSRPNMIAPGRKAMWAAPENVQGAPLPVADTPPPPEEPTEPVAPVILDYSPSVEPGKKLSSTEENDEEPAERGSYYSRRSAKLPRIGDSAGHDALGAMKSVREASEY